MGKPNMTRGLATELNHLAAALLSTLATSGESRVTAREGNRQPGEKRDVVVSRPGLDPAWWGTRSNYAALNDLPTGPTEMSIHTTPFRRVALRLDGFASVHAGADAGDVITHPRRFVVRQRVVYRLTSDGGNVRVEVQDAAGPPIRGFCEYENGGRILRVVGNTSH